MNYIFGNDDRKRDLQERFIRYVKIWSESDGAAADNGVFPSTNQQWNMARVLEEELKALGLQQVQVTDKCYVYGFLPGRGDFDECDSILFLAHMDTVDEVSGKDVKPVFLNGIEKGLATDDVIIKSDGSTLLGGDDKAGVAAIMSALDFLVHNKDVSHRPVEVIFSPDEETGHGMDFVPMDLIKSKRAYTVDGGNEGEMETECFNAWSGSVHFIGKACHTGDAKAGGMINANLLAGDFVSRLPSNMRPETTNDYQGFIAVMEVNSCIEESQVDLLLRSFHIEEINSEKQIIEEAAKQTCEKFGGKVEVSFKQQYLNMKEKLDGAPEVVTALEKAYIDANVKILRKPIRGGTDGSRLTEMGLPTPNIFTGGHEFHSRNEWVSLNQMAKAADVVLNLIIQN